MCIEIRAQQRRAGHGDKISERVGPRHEAFRQQSYGAGVLFGCGHGEEIVDDRAQLVTGRETIRDSGRQSHAQAACVAGPPIACDRRDPRDQPNDRRLVFDAAFEAESDVGAGDVQGRPCAVSSPLTCRVVAHWLVGDAAGHIDGFEVTARRQTRQGEPHGLDLGGIARADRGPGVRKRHLGPRC